MMTHCNNNGQGDNLYEHTPEIKTIMSGRSGFLTRWAVPIIIAMAALAAAMCGYVWFKLHA